MSSLPVSQDPALSPGAGALPIAPGGATRPPDARPAGTGAPASSETRPFADVLASASGPTQIGGLNFSRHALERVQRRGISLEPSTLNRLQEGVGRAASKGSRDSVVLVEGTAFVVSVANRTVLTAVPPEHMREQVFTNIDSAVIA